ncbi:MAG: Ryanodine receptor Ryr [Bacteroidales bacterium]|nr:Ryanodine receptor Ryr [Bacteroidales bacterium]
MVTVNTFDKVAATYTPAPLDLEDVELMDDFDELTEALAENTHEVWSKGRMREGWTYGPCRDDANKKHPDLLPYAALSDGEKEYDRATAINAIKLIAKLGYKISKKIKK